MNNRNWRLPDGVEDLLPPHAWELERLRRVVLDTMHGWGYDYVEPPLIEYLDSLLVGGGRDLDLQTLKVVDQRSGRLLGVRSDMTSQAVRIDAHARPSATEQRLCYAGPVVFANPGGVLASRVPYKAGAEFFGATDISADAEVVALMLACLQACGVEQPVLLLGHMGIYRALAGEMHLDEAAERALFAAVQNKAEAEISALTKDQPGANLMIRLPALMGRKDVLERAARVLADASPAVHQALHALSALADAVRTRCRDVEIRYDISALSGYGYHNGAVFSVYQAEQGTALAQGGRYDGVGESFGNARPATGFDMDLRRLVGDVTDRHGVIWAPASPDHALAEKVAELRGAGRRVIVALDDSGVPPEGMAFELRRVDGKWQLFAREQHGAGNHHSSTSG